MRVLVDTSVWSLALRRRRGPPGASVAALAELVSEARVVMIGPIRQELLSGVRGIATFRALRDRLAAFPDEPLDSDDYVKAAECFNTCRAKGIQGSNTDFLICAVADRRGWSIFTTDGDFTRYARWLPIRLHQPAPPVG